MLMMLLLLLLDLGIIGTAQAIEESEGSDDEWNYIKVEDKKSNGLAAVDENSQPIVEAAFVEKEEIEEQFTTQSEPTIDRNEFEEENVSFLILFLNIKKKVYYRRHHESFYLFSRFINFCFRCS